MLANKSVDATHHFQPFQPSCELVEKVYQPNQPNRVFPNRAQKNSTSYSGAVLWNSLPREIKQSNSLKEFKTKLKNHTFQSELI